MKLAIVGSRGIPARYGGFETFAEELSIRLVQLGIAVTVYCEKRDLQDGVYKGIRLVHVPIWKLGPLTTILFDLRCLWHARKDFDVVYMLGYGSSIFCFLPRLWRRNVWINMDGIEWAREKWGFIAKCYFKIMETIAVRIADRIIADCDAIKHFLEKRHGVLTECSVISYGAPLVAAKPSSTTLSIFNLEEYGYYLVVCRLEPENRILEIMRGFAASKSKRKLIIIGNDRENSYVGKLKNLRDDRINLIGDIYDKAQLQSLRYYSKAYLHGHSVGGTNPSLLEALGCGNPVIAHDNVFNREVAGEAAMYFKNEADIARCIETMDQMDADRCGEISANARKRIVEHYNWEKITDQYHTILAGLKSGKNCITE